jgi:hypothetical protein
VFGELARFGLIWLTSNAFFVTLAGQIAYGGFGVVVNTEGCGPFNTSSILVSHPRKIPRHCVGVFFISYFLYYENLYYLWNAT